MRKSKPATRSDAAIPGSDRWWAEFKAEQCRKQRSEQCARLRNLRRELTQTLVREGLSSLKPGRIPNRWWWLRSEAKWEKFKRDPYAQGYELLRRIPEIHGLLAGSILGPHYSPIPPERDPIHRHWHDLSPGQQERFKFDFDELLEKLGFWVSGGVRVGKKAIIFNCLWPLKRTFACLDAALKNPPPFAVGSPKTLVRKRHRPNKPKPTDRYTRSQEAFSRWQLPDDENPEWIYLPLPLTGLDKEGTKKRLNAENILAVFETFTRTPPENFRRHRAHLRDKAKHLRTKRRRLDQPQPQTLALGLICYDTTLAGASVTGLANWFVQKNHFWVRCERPILGRRKTCAECFRALRHARDKVKTFLLFAKRNRD